MWRASLLKDLSADLIRKAVPRSILRILGNPQCRAMSVALDAHGDKVPMRGVTRNSSPSGSALSGGSP